MSLVDFPLWVEFVAGTSLYSECDRVSHLPILGNGPPGTFVIFPDGLRVSLPTDQIVSINDAAGCACVAFGGMRFIGADAHRLLFIRVRELHPEEQLSPARSHVMTLEPSWVSSVRANDRHVWPV